MQNAQKEDDEHQYVHGFPFWLFLLFPQSRWTEVEWEARIYYARAIEKYAGYDGGGERWNKI
jgi:hypothetical protein